MKLGFSTKNYIQGVLVSFLVVQAIAYILHVALDIPLLKIGWLFILSLVIVAISTLFTLGININQLNMKSIIFMGIVLLIIMALIFALPRILPEIFSIYNPSAIEYSNQLNSIIGGLG